MANALIILSPSLAKGVRDAVIGSIERRFAASGVRYDVLEPPAGGPFGLFVKSRLAGGVDLVVAAGGDGTVSGVINGLSGSSVPLGIIPIGTANLVARELNIPLEIDEAVALIAAAPSSRMLDAMKIDGRVYVLAAGVGITASVAGGTTRRNKSRFGLIAYLGATILKAFEFKQRYLEVEVDGVAQNYHAVEVMVANCGILAKMLFPKGPTICSDDGHLDVWILSTKTFLDYPRYLFLVLRGRPAAPRILCLRAGERIAIRSARPLAVQADGDVIGTTPIEIEVLPRAVKVVVPRESAVEPGVTLAKDIFLAQYLSDFKKYVRGS